MAQDLEPDDEKLEQEGIEEGIDESPDLDMITVWGSDNHDAEMEASAILGMLESNGIEAGIVGNSVLPTLGFEVQVPRKDLTTAERLIQEARAAGPEAAAEAEAASEEPL